jgi:hypothetical protein
MPWKFDERKLSIYTFPIYIFVCILLGGIFGALLDKSIDFLQKDNKGRLESTGFLFFQLIIMSFLIFVFVNGYFSDIIDFEHSLSGAFFFNLSFFTLQPSISENLRAMLNITET